jgi:hypothetical protein
LRKTPFFRRKLLKIAENCWKSPKIVENRRKLLKIDENCWKSPKIAIITSTPGPFNRRYLNLDRKLNKDFFCSGFGKKIRQRNEQALLTQVEFFLALSSMKYRFYVESKVFLQISFHWYTYIYCR